MRQNIKSNKRNFINRKRKLWINCVKLTGLYFVKEVQEGILLSKLPLLAHQVMLKNLLSVNIWIPPAQVITTCRNSLVHIYIFLILRLRIIQITQWEEKTNFLGSQNVMLTFKVWALLQAQRIQHTRKKEMILNSLFPTIEGLISTQTKKN